MRKDLTGWISLVVIMLIIMLSTFCVRNAGWTLTQYGDESGRQGMFYILKNRLNGTTIVVDGGNPENADYARSIIKKNGGHVNAWFLTHYHGDHASVFNAIYNEPDGITIDKIYVTGLDWDTYANVRADWDDPTAFHDFLALTDGDERIVPLYGNDSFMIDKLVVQVFSAYDERLKSYYDNKVPDVPNNCSLVFKIVGKEDSILFCGDAHQDTLADLLIGCYGNLLEAEYVQTGHHGNNSFPEYFYDIVKPKVAFFDAPEWLMTGEKYNAAQLKEYFDNHDVKTFDYRTAPNSFRFH